MVIVRRLPCPRCQHLIRISMKQMSKGRYAVTYFDGRDKNGKVKTSSCPYCKTDLFKSDNLKTLTGLDVAQLES